MDELKALEVLVDGSIFDSFANLTQDGNPIHRDKEAAVSTGFRDTPTQGVYLISIFEQLARMNGFDFRDYSVKFKNPSFPGDRLCFSGKFDADHVVLEARNQELQIVSTCNLKRGSKLSYETPSEKVLRSFECDLNPESVLEFHHLLKTNEQWFPHTLVGALIPSSLLRLGKNGKPLVGIYRGIDVSRFNMPTYGSYRIDILNKEEPKEISGNFIYNIRGIAYSNNYPDGFKNVPILSGDVKVICPEKIDL